MQISYGLGTFSFDTEHMANDDDWSVAVLINWQREKKSMKKVEQKCYKKLNFRHS